MVIWLIGLSGAGKTTLANEVVAQVRCVKNNVVLLDGDMLREVFSNDLGHTLTDRRTNADRICKIGKFLDDQGIHVVCAILSLFPESRSWNRKNLQNYYEVFIDSPMQDLIQRDYKGLYRRFQQGEICDVAGMDIDFPRPVNADIVIKNDTTVEELLSFAKAISQKITGKI
ncbi:MAG: adenylyl-sulfate kinase [Proteobacteria bacterium]|nr:adenylyl-sulfate kinase [Pseudomonadota bacterium]MBU1714525.1 adenylyl-sulfate kinase [Pseudomonadota bacterium]